MSVLRRIFAMRAAHAGWPGPGFPSSLRPVTWWTATVVPVSQSLRRHQPGDRRDDPVEVPGRVDIGVNGTYWAGSIIGTLAALLETQYFAGPFQAPPWRAALAEPIPGRDR